MHKKSVCNLVQMLQMKPETKHSRKKCSSTKCASFLEATFCTRFWVENISTTEWKGRNVIRKCHIKYHVLFLQGRGTRFVSAAILRDVLRQSF